MPVGEEAVGTEAVGAGESADSIIYSLVGERASAADFLDPAGSSFTISVTEAGAAVEYGDGFVVQEGLIFSTTVGTTVRIAVDGYGGDFGNLTLALASRGNGATTIPPGAVGMLDFVNGSYLFDTRAYNADEIFTQPQNIVPGVGLVCPFGSQNRMYLGNLFVDYLKAGNWTIVVEYQHSQDSFYPVIVIATKSDTYAFVAGDVYGYIYMELDTYQPFVYDWAQDDWSEPFSVTERDLPLAGYENWSDIAYVPGFHCIAFTRTDAKLAVSWDGSAVAVNSDPGWAASAYGIDGVHLGDGTAGIIGRVVIYPPQADANLPTLSISSGIMLPPVNDDFVDAITVTVGGSFVGNNYLASFEASEPNKGSEVPGGSVWFKFVAPETRSYKISTVGSNFYLQEGSVVAVYTGASLATLTQVALGSFNGLSGFNDPPLWPIDENIYGEVTIEATAGTTYYISVDGNTTYNPPISSIPAPAYVNFDAGNIYLSITAL